VKPSTTKIVTPLEIGTPEDKLSSLPVFDNHKNDHKYSELASKDASTAEFLKNLTLAEPKYDPSKFDKNVSSPTSTVDSKVPEGKHHHYIKWSLSDERITPQSLIAMFTHMNHKQHEALTSIQRMNRLASDLANERNLLAWSRTSLTCVRTAVTFTVFTGVTQFGTAAVGIMTIGFSVVGLYGLAHGLQRYRRIRDILCDPDPAVEFHRMSNLPMFFFLGAMFVLLIVAQAATQWER
jgi:uncharacterized membrane protein YidH (DUF202 family)